ncbi:MAG: tRNA dihydrouridine synthase DusB [Erysipelotrichia bacterium]|jgi:nifR3 family TIM-barrel protein|nr:tRNA dihydrouridine synthase DusB [Erysipelotrichia bacterium]
MNIGSIKLKNKVIVGPMAGVSDRSFRSLLARYEPGLVYSEMISDKGILYKNQNTLDMCVKDPHEGLVAMQLFGREIKDMIVAARYLNDFSECDIIDINMGCPVSKVVKTNGGASLMKEEDHAAELVYAIKKVITKPLTVKIRKGWDHQSVNAVSMAKKLEAAGADALAIHGRTRSDMYSHHVDLEIIRKVKAALTIPVIGNGDITSVAKAKEMFETTGVDAIMIARGVWGQPWFVKEIIEGLEDRAYIPHEHERFSVFLEHIDAICEDKGEYIGVREMRTHAAMMLKGLPNSAQVKNALVNAQSKLEMIDIMHSYLMKGTSL